MNWERMRVELSRKVGPLPLGGWIAIAAVGVAAAIIIRRRMSAGAAPAAEPALVGPDGETLDASAIAAYTPGGFVVGGGPSQATGGAGASDPFVGEPVEPRTNADWSQAVIRYLTARGYQGTVVVDGVERFLSGLELTSQQQAMIDQALAEVGPPPQPVPPPMVSPTPAPVGSGGGGGSVTPAPAPAPAPAPVATEAPYPTRPFRILRYNGGPDGPGSFVAVAVGTNGSMIWIPDGNTYAGFTSAFPVSTLSESAFVAAVNAAPKSGPAPRWLPPGARWS